MAPPTSPPNSPPTSPPTGVILRQATPADAEAGARMHIACWREAYGPHVDADLLEARLVDEAGWVERWAHQIEHGVPRTLAVAEEELVGFSCMGPNRDETPASLELYALYTRARWWGSGLGQALFEAVLEPEPCSLWVLSANTRAQAFYRRNGFEADGAVERYDPLGADELRMVRDDPAAPHSSSRG